MKKWLCLLLAVCMLLSMAACSKGGEIQEDPALQAGNSGGGSNEPANPDHTEPDPTPDPGPTQSGNVYDTGCFSVQVPEGWKEFPQTDIFSDSDEIDPTQLVIIKGGTSDFDMFTKPYIMIKYGGPSTELYPPDADWYDETEDLGTITTGEHTWTGFSGLSFSSKLMILFEDLGDVQLQATLYYETDEDSFTLEDADVQAVLSSIEITDPDGKAALSGNGGGGTEGPTDPATSAYDWWSGSWYGWWSTIDGGGKYEQNGIDGSAWDAYAVIDVHSDDTGDITLWYGGDTRELPLVTAKVRFIDGEGEKGAMELLSGTFFPTGHWYHEQEEAATMEILRGGWYVDPEDSTVSHFADMIEIGGHYEDPDNPEDYFEYRFYLRPWGVRWEDVESGDTSGCVYQDMMPIYYEDWYLPLLDLGYTEVPDSFEIGYDIVEDQIPAPNNGGGEDVGGSFVPTPLDPNDREGADGKVDLATLQRVLPWLKEAQSYSLTYDEIAAQFGVHGMSVESPFEGTIYFRWWSDEDNYIQVAFNPQPDGTETWNNTQWDGID